MNDVTLTLDQIALPTEAKEPRVNCESMILFGKEKCGKTTALSLLDSCLIIDTEKGSDLIKAVSLQVTAELGPVGKMKWLKQLARQLKENCPYKRIAIDTFTEINEWAEW